MSARPWSVGLALLLAVVVGLRFLSLDLDFPVEITVSEAAYTDEGWYCNAAVRDVVGQPVYLEGDVNEATVQPLFHAAQRLSFALFGLSTHTARLTAVTFFLALCLLLGGALRQHGGNTAALCGVLVLLLHFPLFVYSRVALVELPMLVPIAAGLWWMHQPTERDLSRGFVGGLSMSLAALLKFSALFLGPATLFIALALSGGWAGRWRALVGYAGGASLAALYWTVQGVRHPLDVGAFLLGLVAPDLRGGSPLSTTAKDFAVSFARMDPSLTLAIGLAVALLLVELWRERSSGGELLSRFDVHLLALSGCAALMPAVSAYQPLRYFLPAIVFGVALTAAVTARAVLTESTWRFPLVLLLLATAAGSLNQTARYLADGSTSWLDAAREITASMEASSPERTLLLGDVAPQISLETGVAAVSGRLGTASLTERARRHRPTHAVFRGPMLAGERRQFEEEDCRPHELGVWSVFTERRQSRPLHLYRLEGCRWRSPVGSPGRID